MKHTQGEWAVMSVGDNQFAIKEKELIERGFSDRIATVSHYPESEQNAKLIAAAPELLEALKSVRDLIASGEHIKNGMPICKIINEAYLKAIL